MANEERKRAQAAARSKRYRQRKKQQSDVELAAVSDTPLVRGTKGLEPRPEPEFEIYNPKIHGRALDPRGIPGQREHQPTPYGSEARKARQQAERDRQVIDYTTPDSMPSIYERPVSRLRGLLPSQRHDSVLRQQHEARIRAHEEGLLEQNEAIDWGLMTSLEDQGDYDQIMAEREATQEAGSPAAYQHSVRFANPWSKKGFDPDAVEMADARDYWGTR